MSQYKTGTVSATNGSQVVTGTGTLWLSNVSPGDGFTVAGTGVPYTVGSVDSNEQMTLNANYAGPSGSGLAYAIWRDFTAQNNLPEMSQGDIETATTFTRAMRLIDGSLADIQGDYYKSDNILGTASQSGGIPTGAIIERGSNANGEYTKFADGTMICKVDFGISTVVDSTYILQGINIYRHREAWTFPAAFSPLKPSVSISVSQNGEDQFTSGKVHTTNTTSSDLDFLSFRSFGSFALNGASAIAIGRWF